MVTNIVLKCFYNVKISRFLAVVITLFNDYGNVSYIILLTLFLAKMTLFILFLIF